MKTASESPRTQWLLAALMAFLVAMMLGGATQAALADETDSADQRTALSAGASGNTVPVLTLQADGAAATIDKLALPKNYIFATCQVLGVTAGEVKYDAATKTLTLKNVVAEDLSTLSLGLARAESGVTVKLVGTNKISSFYCEEKSSKPITITGSGSLATDFSTIVDLPIAATGSSAGSAASFADAASAFNAANAANAANAGSLAGFANAGGAFDMASLANAAGAANTPNSSGTANAAAGAAAAATAKTCTLRLAGGTVKGDISSRFKTVEVAGGKLVGNIGASYLRVSEVKLSKGSITGTIHCEDLTVSGGAVKAIASGSYERPIECKNAFKMKKGTVTATGERGISCKSFAISNGTLRATAKGTGNASGLFCSGNYVQTGGTVVAKGYYGVTCANLTMKKGKLGISDATVGIDAGGYGQNLYTFKQTGGTVAIKNPKKKGIAGTNCNVSLKGGSLSVTKSYGSGIWLASRTYAGKTYGGKMKVSGGKLAVTVRTPSGYPAIYANSLSDKPACLKSIKGGLPKGATIKKGGNTYRTTAQAYGTGTVTLLKYGSKAKKVTLDKVKFGSTSYSITGIGAKAFATAKGKKVTSITAKNYLNSIGASAFSGTKALTKLSVKLNVKTTYDAKGRLKSVTFYDDMSIAKKAFSKMGKSGGAKLTVKLNSGVLPSEQLQYRKLLRSHGMPAKTVLAPKG